MSKGTDLGLASNSIRGYELIRRLGQGSMGVVYEAKNLGTGDKVALKILFPHFSGNISFIKRFQQEATTAMRLKHQNIVQVHGFGFTAPYHFIEMEYVEGFNMGEILNQEGALSLARTAAVGICVASALGYAWQEEKMIHRDIKPENLIKVTHDDGADVKICDLGIAKILGKGGEQHLTQTGFAVGSPHYIAPEQVLSAANINFRADMYGLGATLYHMATGRTVHKSDSEFGIMQMHVKNRVADPREFAPGFDARFAQLLDSMLELDPEKRPENWSVVYDELEEIYLRLNESPEPRTRFKGP